MLNASEEMKMHEVLSQLGFETKNGRDYCNFSKELAVVVLSEGFYLYAWGNSPFWKHWNLVETFTGVDALDSLRSWMEVNV